VRLPDLYLSVELSAFSPYKVPDSYLDLFPYDL
jgi:hypothetical protein